MAENPYRKKNEKRTTFHQRLKCVKMQCIFMCILYWY